MQSFTTRRGGGLFWLAGLSCLFFAAEPGVAADGAGPPLRCERVAFPVALAAGAPADQEVVGTLCARGAIQNRTIQVLVHGGTYDHNYWDFPFQPETYSYVEAMTRAGYATLALDRLGSGESSKPAPGVALDLHVGAFAVHQIVQSLRSGRLVVPGHGRIRGERIVLVGHSLGSYIAVVAAALYDDVDGVILSSFGHDPGPGTDLVRQLVYPAVFDPKFADSGLPLDYFTTLPGVRGLVFYHLPETDPEVLAIDEALKQTVTLGELLDTANAAPRSVDIRVPTLVVIGDFDSFACTPPCSESGWLEQEFTEDNYGPRACVEGAIIPDSGHNLNLHKNAPIFFDLAREWVDRRVGPSTRSPPAESCP